VYLYESHAKIAGIEMAAPISAFIIAQNEEARLPRTIAALRSWVDEIIVVDSGSTDRTVELARSVGAKVFYREWSGYGNQKRFAEKCCRNDWVLNVDADEVVTPALADEICGLFSGENRPRPGGYKVRILNVYPGDQKPRPFADDYNVVRLYHRAVGRYREHPIFDRVILKETPPRQLSHPIYHYSYISLAHIIEKNNKFSSFRTESFPPRSRPYLLFRLWFEFPVSFLKSYFLRRHCTGGWKGFYFSLCLAFLRTTVVAKMLERASSPDATRPTSAASLQPLKTVRDASERPHAVISADGAHTF
jgi:glycosyltransferase involved in cell wall biosynthesis